MIPSDPRPKIITPAEAIARVRIRPRSAPPRRSAMGVGGWIEWGLFDRKGRQVRGGQQHNLVLDTLLEAIPTDHMIFGAFAMDARFTHAAVGTGSVEPSVTDTALGAQVARTATKIGTDPSNQHFWTRTSTGVYEAHQVWQFDFAEANGNLTEWGFAYGASADLWVRELFRDELGDPVVVTKTSDFQLRIKYTVTQTIGPVEPVATTVTIAGVGDVGATFFQVNGGGSYTQHGRRCLWQAAAGFIRTTANNSPGEAVAGALHTATGATPTGAVTNSAIANTFTADSYVANSRQRALNAGWSSTFGNLNPIFGVGVSNNNTSVGARYYGYLLLFDEDDRFEKDSLHALTIDDLLIASWDREGS